MISRIPIIHIFPVYLWYQVYITYLLVVRRHLMSICIPVGTTAVCCCIVSLACRLSSGEDRIDERIAESIGHASLHAAAATATCCTR